MDISIGGILNSTLSSSLTAGRPNTQLQKGLLRADVTLCCGEDLEEFITAITAVFGKPRRRHVYRCYAFLETRGVSFIWTGIGSGCLEPLLCEIADEPQMQRIILVGTAGAVASGARLGSASAILEARMACAGVSPRKAKLFPNWPLPSDTATQSIVSTDSYYGFTLKKGWPRERLWAADTRLPKSVAKALRQVDLVEMETGQFYHLCQVLFPERQFLAIKGAANPLSNFSEQVLHSQSVLHDSLRKAKALFSDSPHRGI